MGFMRNETYLWPAARGASFSDRVLAALVSDLIAKRVVCKPFAAVTGKNIELPFTVYSDLGDVLGGKNPPAGMTVLYRGTDARKLVGSLAKRDGDLVVYFADVPPMFEDIPEEHAHAVLIFALAEPRDIDLHQQKFDEDFREIPGTATARYRVGTTVVVHGTEIDGTKYHPVRDLTRVLENHLGPIERQYDILD
jgi:hypothetical protein